MTHTEQIKVVAEYMYPQAKWVKADILEGLVMLYPETFEGGYPMLSIDTLERYANSLDALSPVYKKVMAELEGYEDGVSFANDW